MTEIPSWHISGDWFDNCSCAVACPCTFAQAPDNGFCESVLFWHIRQGCYRDINLDDLTGPTSLLGEISAADQPARFRDRSRTGRDVGQIDGLLGRCFRLQVAVDEQFEQAHPVRPDGSVIARANGVALGVCQNGRR